MQNELRICVVDDDQPVRDSLYHLLANEGYFVEAYDNAEELLHDYKPGIFACFVLDVQLPGMDGLGLWQSLRDAGDEAPCILMSGHGNISTAVASLQRGAIDFLEKPFQVEQLLKAVQVACRESQNIQELDELTSNVSDRIRSLTQRELQVMEMVVDGALTKQIAKRLNISEKTVEVHRSRVTRKLQVESVAQLVRVITSYALIHTPGMRRRQDAAGISRLRHYLHLGSRKEIQGLFGFQSQTGQA
jgi:two-component system response regulator TtrR